MASNNKKPAKTIWGYLYSLVRRFITPSFKGHGQPTDEEQKVALFLARKKFGDKPLASGGWDKHCVYFYPVGTTDASIDEIGIRKWKATLWLLLMKIWAAAFYNAREKNWR